MRKVFTVTGIIFIILIIGVGIVNLRLDRECKDIQLKEVSTSGEKATVDKAMLEMYVCGRKGLAWNFEVSLNHQKVRKTSVHKSNDEKFSGTLFSETAPYKSGFYTDTLFDLRVLISDIENSSYYDLRPKALYYNEDDPTLNKNYRGFIQTYKAFSKNAEEGGSSEPIKVNTLMEYYPMGNKTTFKIPKYYDIENQGDFNYSIRYGPVGSNGHIYDVLTKKFKIPVQDDELIRFEDYSEKNLKSKIVRVEDTDFYEMRGYNAINDKYCFFTFDTHTDKGKVVDTSQIEEGYGIYRVPLKTPGKEKEWVKKNQPFDIDKMSKVIDLNPKIKVLGMGKGYNEDIIILVYEDEPGKIIVAEINGKTGTIKSRARLDSKVDKINQCRGYEDFVFLTFTEMNGENKIAVLKRTSENKLKISFQCDLQQSEGNEEKNLYIEDADFDDNKLITISREKTKTYEMDYEEIKTDLCDFTVSVYTSEGEIFDGKYTTSLTNPFIAKNKGDKKYEQYSVIRKLKVHW